MQVRPPDPALFIGEDVGGAKIETKAAHFLVELDRNHVEIEVVAEDNLLKGLVKGSSPLPFVHVCL